MRASLSKAVFILIYLIISACSTRSEYYHTSGGGANSLSTTPSLTRSWADLPVDLYIDSDFPEEFEEAVIKAVSLWEESGVPLFNYRGRTSDGHCNKSSDQNFDGINLICWDTTAHPDGYLGSTKVSYSNGNVLDEADITVYGDPNDFSILDCPNGELVCTTNTGKFDVVTTLMHEMGHFVGFVDTSLEDSVMNPYFGMDTVAHQLDETLLDNLYNGYDDYIDDVNLL